MLSRLPAAVKGILEGAVEVSGRETLSEICLLSPFLAGDARTQILEKP
jgi:hypothetical protein